MIKEPHKRTLAYLSTLIQHYYSSLHSSLHSRYTKVLIPNLGLLDSFPCWSCSFHLATSPDIPPCHAKIGGLHKSNICYIKSFLILSTASIITSPYLDLPKYFLSLWQLLSNPSVIWLLVSLTSLAYSTTPCPYLCMYLLNGPQITPHSSRKCWVILFRTYSPLPFYLSFIFSDWKKSNSGFTKQKF